MAKRPFYRRYPSNFLAGTFQLNLEQKGVYGVVIDLLYDKWGPLEMTDGALARVCGCSTRCLRRILAELFALEKLRRLPDGRITNDRFEEEKKHLGEQPTEHVPEDITATTSNVTTRHTAKEPLVTSKLNPDLKQHINSKLSKTFNENTPFSPRLSRARATLDTRYQTPDKATPRPSIEVQADAVASDIQRCCKALGVSLQASTWRGNWTLELIRMLADDTFDLEADILPVLENYHRRKPDAVEDVRSLRFFRADFIERRNSRALTETLTARAAAPEATATAAPALSIDDWFNYLRAFLKVGAWVRSTCGPPPTEPGCLAPPQLIARAAEFWRKQGDHPECCIRGNGFEPWTPEGGDVFPEIKPFYFGPA